MFRRISPSTSYTSDLIPSLSGSPCATYQKRKEELYGEEIPRLLAADFIMEVFFPEWLANPVLVLKKNK